MRYFPDRTYSTCQTRCSVKKTYTPDFTLSCFSIGLFIFPRALNPERSFKNFTLFCSFVTSAHIKPPVVYIDIFVVSLKITHVKYFLPFKAQNIVLIKLLKRCSGHFFLFKPQ